MRKNLVSFCFGRCFICFFFSLFIFLFNKNFSVFILLLFIIILFNNNFSVFILLLFLFNNDSSVFIFLFF